MDQTYNKVSGQCRALYQAVDKKATMRFFEKAMLVNGVPEKVTMDKSDANKSAIDQIVQDRKISKVVSGFSTQHSSRSSPLPTQIEIWNFLALRQFLCRTFTDDAAAFQHIGVLRGQ